MWHEKRHSASLAATATLTLYNGLCVPPSRVSMQMIRRPRLQQCYLQCMIVITLTLTLLLLVVFFAEDSLVDMNKFAGMLKWQSSNGEYLDNLSRKQEQSARETAIDFSRCPPDSPLRVFVYESPHPLAAAFVASPFATKKEKDACFFIAIYDGSIERNSLAHWSGGTNHLVVNVNESTEIEPAGKEILLQANFPIQGSFRSDVDFVGSVASLERKKEDFWVNRTALLPLWREHLLTVVRDEENVWPKEELAKLSNSEGAICVDVSNNDDAVEELSQSTFAVLPPSSRFQSLLLASLRAGSIPVVLTNRRHPRLPFQEFLDWRLASVQFPLERFGSLNSLLVGLSVPTLLEYKRRGRIFLDSFLNDADGFSSAVLSALTSRLSLPLRTASVTPTKPAFHDSYSAPLSYTPDSNFTEGNHRRIPSPSSRHSLIFATHSYALWNNGRDVAFLPPSLYDDHSMLAEVEHYEDSQQGMEPVFGAHSFEQYEGSLGGNRVAEQYTVIVLTYNRDDGLKNLLEELNGTPHLNKVLVVWNDLARSPSNISWPSLHVPVEFILPEANSLNNRFLPFDRLETDAVVSLDDDIDVAHDEIEFAFRVWRSNTDRLVGFPDRFHGWRNGRGTYGASSSCEYSMILTGFAFLHRNFMYEYFRQPKTILSHIDSMKNCEDIAMNFLASHLTRKSPIKIGHKTSYQCKKCKVGLSGGGAHYGKRDKCVTLFTNIYGYNPLIGSQDRAMTAFPGHCMKIV